MCMFCSNLWLHSRRDSNLIYTWIPEIGCVHVCCVSANWQTKHFLLRMFVGCFRTKNSTRWWVGCKIKTISGPYFEMLINSDSHHTINDVQIEIAKQRVKKNTQRQNEKKQKLLRFIDDVHAYKQTHVSFGRTVSFWFFIPINLIWCLND